MVYDTLYDRDEWACIWQLCLQFFESFCRALWHISALLCSDIFHIRSSSYTGKEAIAGRWTIVQTHRDPASVVLCDEFIDGAGPLPGLREYRFQQLPGKAGYGMVGNRFWMFV